MLISFIQLHVEAITNMVRIGPKTSAAQNCYTEQAWKVARGVLLQNLESLSLGGYCLNTFDGCCLDCPTTSAKQALTSMMAVPLTTCFDEDHPRL